MRLASDGVYALDQYLVVGAHIISVAGGSVSFDAVNSRVIVAD